MASVTKFTGADKALKQLRGLMKVAPNEFEKALRQESEIEAKECKRRCPVDTGTLRGTIHVDGPHREGRRVWCTIGAGGPAAPYALTVHEDLDALHTVGEAKFIERPLKESAPYLAERIAKRIDLNNKGTAPEGSGSHAEEE